VEPDERRDGLRRRPAAARRRSQLNARSLGAQFKFSITAKMTAEVLRRGDDTLATAKLGLTDVLEGRPERRLGGLRNLIVFGRAVSNVPQNLRSIWPEFDSSYQP